jgi:hypothetical protein
MRLRSLALAATLALTFIATANAVELRPAQGRSVHLGKLSGVAYYTVDGDRYRVVATLADGEAGTPVRFETALLAGQSIVLSTPGAAGAAPVAVEISRQQNQIVVQKIGTPSN